MGKRGPMAGVPTAKRFWMKVSKCGPTAKHMTTRCWVWTRSTFRDGYGQFKDGARNMKTHRMAWELATGEVLPPTVVLRHACDNRLCVRIDHLLKGTPADNARDRSERGGLDGEKNGRAVLTASQVRLMRRLFKEGADVSKLMRRFDVAQTTVVNAVLGRTWKSV